jgi:hypothetical protein
MDYYATALIEIFVNVLFWLKSRFTKKPLVKGRPSVPSVPHHLMPSKLRIQGKELAGILKASRLPASAMLSN